MGYETFLKKIFVFLISFCFCFFQAVIFVFDGYAQTPPPAPQASGPIDIQADEQEFADDQVIAKGNVRVTYKDTIIHAPLARLFRDPAGQPQKAVFVGHPFMTQGESKMNAETLIFEIADSKVIAQGHAHSEVDSNGDADLDPKSSSKDKKSKTLIAKTKTAEKAPENTSSKNTPFKWPTAADDQSKDASENNIQVAETDTKDSAVYNTVTSVKSSPTKNKKNSSAAGEKIITDSDVQEYDKAAGKFDASGHVHVVNGDISVFSDKLRLVYGTDNKPETALFTGHVNADQNKNNTQSDLMTYYLQTKRLQATGNVRSKVIQEKPPETPSNIKNSKKVISSNQFNGNPARSGGAANAVGGETGAKTAADDTIFVLSDSQDYSKETGRMAADGNVKVYYQNTVGVGPKAILIRNEQGNAEKVIFTGRSQISQPGKRWIGDRMTFTVATKKVLAEGNTKAYILQSSPEDKHKSTTSTVALSPGSGHDHVQLAQRTKTTNAADTYSNKSGSKKTGVKP